MKKDMKKPLWLLAGLLLGSLLVSGVFAEDPVPGTASDPLVTRGYVDKLIEALSARVQTLESVSPGTGAEAPKAEEPNTETKETTAEQPASASFVVVEVPAATRVIGKEGTEMILRAGTATAIDNGVDGVSDLTAAKDLKEGAPIEKNHLLLIPRSDGRGISCAGLCYVMIKGEYSFE